MIISKFNICLQKDFVEALAKNQTPDGDNTDEGLELDENNWSKSRPVSWVLRTGWEETANAELGKEYILYLVSTGTPEFKLPKLLKLLKNLEPDPERDDKDFWEQLFIMASVHCALKKKLEAFVLHPFPANVQNLLKSMYLKRLSTRGEHFFVSQSKYVKS